MGCSPYFIDGRLTAYLAVSSLEKYWNLRTTTSEQLDVYEADNDIVVRASVAGVPEDKVDISYEKGILTISAEEKEGKKEGKKFYQRASRSYSYRVAVPGNVNTKKEPKAEVENGIVEVRFSKANDGGVGFLIINSFYNLRGFGKRVI